MGFCFKETLLNFDFLVGYLFGSKGDENLILLVNGKINGLFKRK